MSPELLDPDQFGLKEGNPTKESDCYALGMVIYEVLSGQPPFSECRGFVVIRKVLAGERPKRPQGDEGKLFTDGIWGILKLCWKPQPHDRISAKAILSGLEGNLPRSSRLLTRTGIRRWFFGDSQSDTTVNNCTFSPFRPRLVFDDRVTIGNYNGLLDLLQTGDPKEEQLVGVGAQCLVLDASRRIVWLVEPIERSSGSFGQPPYCARVIAFLTSI